MKSKFIEPETKRLELADGDWLIVKRRLSAGERFDSYPLFYMRNPDGNFVQDAAGKFLFDPSKVSFVNVAIYLLDWSVRNKKGDVEPIAARPIDEVIAVLRNLDEDEFRDIENTVSAHDALMEKERKAQKKTRSGAPESSQTSPSLENSESRTPQLVN